jgi:hypothetical protein
MCTDPTILGSFFQKVGSKELKFLVDSGAGFGFLLGISAHLLQSNAFWSNIYIL